MNREEFIKKHQLLANDIAREYCRRNNGVIDLGDLQHEALRALDHAALKFRSEQGNDEGWAKFIVHQKLGEYCERERRRLERETPGLMPQGETEGTSPEGIRWEEVDPNANPHFDARRAESWRNLQEILKDWPQSARDLLDLFSKGATLSEIGKALGGKSKQAVGERLRKLRQELKIALTNRGFVGLDTAGGLLFDETQRLLEEANEQGDSSDSSETGQAL